MSGNPMPEAKPPTPLSGAPASGAASASPARQGQPGETMTKPKATATQASAAPKKKQCALKGVFFGDYSGVRGTFLAVMDIENQKLSRLNVIIASDRGEFRFQIKQDWKSFEDTIIRAKLQGVVAHQLSMEVQSYVNRMLSEDAGVSVCENIRTGHPDEIRRILIEVFSRAIADSDVLMELDVETVEETVEDPSTQSAAQPVDSEKPAGEVQNLLVKEVVLRVEPILSPVLGIAAKELRPGMGVIVEIKEQSTLKQNVSRLLSVRGSGEKPTALGTVLEVAAGVHDRITIRMSLAPNVIGITNIFGDLRVKVPDAQTARAMANMMSESSEGPTTPMALSTPAFVLATLGIFTIMLILAYLIFGGVIG